MTEEEVKALLKMGNESGTFDDDEKEMIDSVFKFDRRTARQARLTLFLQNPLPVLLEISLTAFL